MAYVSKWESLDDALARVIEATGESEVEAQHAITRALADGVVEIRAKPVRHATKGLTAAKTILAWAELEIPPRLGPKDLNWERSSTTKPWMVRNDRLRGFWDLAGIELSRSDVTTLLCGPQTEGDTSGKTASESAPTTPRPLAAPAASELPVPANGAGAKSNPARTTADTSGRRRRGRRPMKSEQAQDAMRKDIRQGLPAADLNEMIEKELAARYGVSRDTARKARAAVLSEITEPDLPTNSDNRQLPTRK
jgi:hypothetical protein